MLNGKKVLAVIPARAGSKRCPGKNVREFRGKPLVVWAMEVALASKAMDMVVLSSDDDATRSLILDGAFWMQRDPELASDTATNEDVCRDVLERAGGEFGWVVLLQPTSPLRTVQDIHRTLDAAMYGGYDAACTYSSSGQKNGAVYACSAGWLRDGKDFTKWYADPYFMPEERSLDIDYPEDFDK